MPCAQAVCAYDFSENEVYYNILEGQNCVEVTFSNEWGNSYSGEVTIPETVIHDGTTYTVTAIGDKAFNNSFSLSDIVVPSTIKTVGNQAFKSCAFLKSYAFGEGLLSIGDEAFNACNTLAAINIPASVTSIGKDAFAYCQGVNKIDVAAGNPNYATDGTALYDKTITRLLCCPAGLITEYTFPATVTSYEQGAFLGANLLPGIKVASGNTAFKATDGVLYTADGRSLLFAPKGLAVDIVIPEGCAEIAAEAFKSCTKLPSVIFPQTLTAIGDNAFASCAALTEVTIPGSVKSIGDAAFYGCSNITSATLEEGIETLGSSAFYYGTALATVKLPSTLTSIGGFAFAYCTIANLYNAAIEPQTLQADTFSDYSGTLHVQNVALDAYQSAEYWKNFAQIQGDVVSGMEGIAAGDAEPAGYYDLNGRRHSSTVKGISIVKMSDGSYKKVIVR